MEIVLAGVPALAGTVGFTPGWHLVSEPVRASLGLRASPWPAAGSAAVGEGGGGVAPTAGNDGSASWILIEKAATGQLSTGGGR